jgi:hypothetical protein
LISEAKITRNRKYCKEYKKKKKKNDKEFVSIVTGCNERDVDCRKLGVSRHITAVLSCKSANNNNNDNNNNNIELQWSQRRT